MHLNPFRLWVYKMLVHDLPETRFFGLKAGLLRWAGAQIGNNVRINSSAVFSGNGKLTIGSDVWIGAGDVICPTGGAEISIGSCCDLGPQVMIITGTHEIDPRGAHVGGRGCSKSVQIGDGCWLGARTTILPGVTLQKKTVVAAGAVVVKSEEKKGGLLAGVPAVYKRQIAFDKDA